MLREGSSLLGQPVRASDGKLGVIEDVRFDDRTWVVRHLVVRTGVPLRHERLLIEPALVQKPEPTDDELGVWLSKREARQAPQAESELTVAQQRRIVRLTTWRLRVPDWLMSKDGAQLVREAERLIASDRHLRSMKAVRGYRVNARDGGAGRLKDLVIDDQTWSVCHLEIEADLMWGRKPVLLLPRWVERVGYDERAIDVALTRNVLGGAPRFQRLGLVSRLYQMYLYDYYAAASGEATPRMGPRRRLDTQMIASTLGE